ncbi:MGH1-like glycoside hydrolase domain-containing protein [Sphingomonas aerophila]|uniref:Mannosylglycerate hydrolase MGH1-like glycoside hydrolase domain-containing protein n=1 Tax=Sphingomonas aerophila TaxID=1344948 RepID=A0A7W9BGB3_9SPHN|nr:alpha-L-rhamnosidase [Sphingomonas aerophila]MBB5716730.1 hypothetical protein [Sphingomonas aerophila]
MIDRRFFLAGSAALAASGPLRAAQQASEPTTGSVVSDAPVFRTGNARWQAAYDKALDVLARNVRIMPYVSKPVLIEGSVYRGVWQECGPHEALLYRHWRPDVAVNSHMTFFDLQRADGQLPANNKETETGFGQIQMVVPIAATAWDLARATGDEALLHAAYSACSAWDAWLMRYRNTLGTGLVEGFCTYDTGHDNSPRWAGLPNQCPNKNAKQHHAIASLPRLCPDLSATVYGARRALAAMARALGKGAEADRWEDQASAIRRTILARLWSEGDAAFYDRDATGQFVRVRGDVLTRMCGEHVPDQAMFNAMWRHQLGDPAAFWTRFPLPSIAANDPAFVRPIPANSWGGASQALTAMRAGRWFDRYGRSAEFGHMMTRWCEAIMADMTFRQQIDPSTGVFTGGEDRPDYSPCALVMVENSWRLVGMTEEDDVIHWNIRPRHLAAREASLSRRTGKGGRAAMHYREDAAELSINGRALARVTGHARLVTDVTGHPVQLVGIERGTERVTVQLADSAPRTFRLRPNKHVPLN